jgi:hypothetical protein
MNDPQPPDRRGFHLLDLGAIVVGYGMASLLVRAFWPDSGRPPIPEILVIALFYAWLGLAMSGPLVLLARRPTPPTRDPDAGPEAAGSRTWAELAWLIIGFYWNGMTVLVVPVRLRRSPLHDAAILGLFPIIAALFLKFAHGPTGRGRSRRGPASAPVRDLPAPAEWTHTAAVGLILTWPLAWVALILLGKNLS